MKKISIKVLTLFLIISSFSLSSSINKAEASTIYVDPHVDVIKATKNTSGTITVQYKIKKVRPSAVNVCIGYEWPSTYRLSTSQNYCKSTANKIGTHTMTIPKPSINIIGTQKVIAKVIGGGGRYTNTKNIKSVFNHPTTRKTTYHTVTKKEALAEYIVIGGLGVGVKYMKKNAIGFVTGAVYASYTTHYGLKGIGVVSGFPPRVAGQYFKVETYYSQKGLHVKTTIWNSKASYSSNHKPIYTGTSTSAW